MLKGCTLYGTVGTFFKAPKCSCTDLLDMLRHAIPTRAAQQTGSIPGQGVPMVKLPSTSWAAGPDS